MTNEEASRQLTLCNDRERSLNDDLHRAIRDGDADQIKSAHRALQDNFVEKQKLQAVLGQERPQ